MTSASLCSCRRRRKRRAAAQRSSSAYSDAKWFPWHHLRSTFRHDLLSRYGQLRFSGQSCVQRLPLHLRERERSPCDREDRRDLIQTCAQQPRNGTRFALRCSTRYDRLLANNALRRTESILRHGFTEIRKFTLVAMTILYSSLYFKGAILSVTN